MYDEIGPTGLVEMGISCLDTRVMKKMVTLGPHKLIFSVSLLAWISEMSPLWLG